MLPEPDIGSQVFLEQVELLFQFVLYSACTAMTMRVPGLSSSSVLVTALNLVEVLGFVLILARLGATFVDRSPISH
jgi:hypothetical protein